MTDLIERLRHPYPEIAGLAADEAADRIEALTAENERLRAALTVLRKLPIVENDNPNTLHLDGVAYTGPVVDWLFRVVRKIKEVAGQAIGDKNHD